MKTYHYNIPNTDAWAICDTEIIVVADNKFEAERLLKATILAPNHVFDPEKLLTLRHGVHLIQIKN